MYFNLPKRMINITKLVCVMVLFLLLSPAVCRKMYMILLIIRRGGYFR